MSGAKGRAKRLSESKAILRALGFSGKQANDTAGYVLLALAGLKPSQPWPAATNGLIGITPIIEFVRAHYGVKYAPNTRETVRDEAVNYFVQFGMVLKNPDKPSRPTNSGNTVYQIEPSALALLRTCQTAAWEEQLTIYLASRRRIQRELERQREMARLPLTLPSGETVTLSPGGQNPLIKAVVEEFCPRFVPGGTVVYIGDAESKFLHYDSAYLNGLGIIIAPAAKMPDIVVHDTNRNWLVLVEAVASAGAVDGKRRAELKALFKGCKAGLVFVTAFANGQFLEPDFMGDRSLAGGQSRSHNPLRRRAVFGSLPGCDAECFVRISVYVLRMISWNALRKTFTSDNNGVIPNSEKTRHRPGTKLLGQYYFAAVRGQINCQTRPITLMPAPR